MLAFTYMKESKQPAFDVAADQLCIILYIAHRFVLLSNQRVYLKQGICELIENHKMKNNYYFSQWDSHPVPSTHEVDALAIALRSLISVDWLKCKFTALTILLEYTCSTW